MSPQVGGTVVWFLRHFSKSYLLPDEREYEQLSVTLSSVLGQDTNGGKWTIGFLLEKVRSNLTHWSSEPALAEDTVLLLLSLVDTKQRLVILCINDESNALNDPYPEAIFMSGAFRVVHDGML